MKYMGSKARHAKEILPIILAGRTEGQWYVEPFVGGANVIDRVGGNRIGADFNPYVVALWQAVADGWVPHDLVTEEEYSAMNKARLVDAETAYAAFTLSFGGKFFGGYRRDVAGTKGCIENMRTQSRRAKASLMKQAALLRGVQFHHCSYDQLDIPPKSIIYCDPPYAGTTGYVTGAFDHAKFWQWCREKVAEGHKVYVSEYTAPDDWVCVWEKQVNNTLTKDTGSKKGVERLFCMDASVSQGELF